MHGQQNPPRIPTFIVPQSKKVSLVNKPAYKPSFKKFTDEKVPCPGKPCVTLPEKNLVSRSGVKESTTENKLSTRKSCVKPLPVENLVSRSGVKKFTTENTILTGKSCVKPLPVENLVSRSGVKESTTENTLSKGKSCVKPLPVENLVSRLSVRKPTAENTSCTGKTYVKSLPEKNLSSSSGIKKTLVENSTGGGKTCVKFPRLEKVISTDVKKTKAENTPFTRRSCEYTNAEEKSKAKPEKPIDPHQKRSVKSQFLNKSPVPISKSNTNTDATIEDINHLASQFEHLTTSVLSLASSQISLGARSLEALLTKEISNCLGSTVNSPRVSQRFIQATRGLLDNLVCLYEEGRLNTHLLKHQKTTGQSYLKAKSSTNICYRDKYLKELVMNVLKSMCSNEIEEEVSKASCVRQPLGAASRERIKVIRDMVRAEAGLEPETFHEFDQKLAELQRSLSRTQTEMLQAAEEVERVISEKFLSNADSTSTDLIIPEAAREALRRSYDKHSNCGDEIDELRRENNNLTPKNSLNCESSGSLERMLSSKSEVSAQTNIQPCLVDILREELDRVKAKKIELLEGSQFAIEATYLERRVTSTEDYDVNNDPDDDEDEINQEETVRFLEALKVDIEQNNSSMVLKGDEYLEPIQEAKDTIDETESVEVFLSEDIKENLQPVESVIKRELEDEGLKDENYNSPISNTLTKDSSNVDLATYILESNNFQSDLSQNENINSFKHMNSKWWSYNSMFRSTNEVSERLKFMTNNVFNGFYFDGNEFKLGEEPILENMYQFDFTIEEVVKILRNVSLKIEQLPSCFQTEISKGQKQQICCILNILGINVNGSDIIDYENLEYLSYDDQFLSSCMNSSKSFSLLSKALSSAPEQVKTYSFSALIPPNSLMTTLALLASTEYFKDCFISVLSSEKRNQSGFGCDFNKISSREPYINCSNTEEKIEKVHYSISDTISNDSVPRTAEEVKETPITSSFSKRISVLRASFKNNRADVDKHISNFEHYLGLTPSVMSVQDVSDMFIFISSVLNDVPDRIKNTKISSLNPPATFLKALNILYDDDDPLADVDKKTSFESLTIQNVSDFFLTASEALQKVPEKVRYNSILDMDPPISLLRAINLLTSLSNNSILENKSLEDVQQDLCKDSSQESFFDALDSFSSSRPLSR